MTSGTKIVLAVIAAFVGVLVVYYGFFMGPAESDLVVADDPTAAAVEEAPASSPVVGQPAGDEAGEPAAVLGREESQAPAVTPAPPVAGDEGRQEMPIIGRTGLPLLVPTGQPNSDGGNDGSIRAAQDANPGQGTAQPPAERPQPAPARPVTPPPSDPPRNTEPIYTPYVVRSGDTLSAIASDWFGSANDWDLIVAVNPGLEPNRLRIGQTLRLPPRDARLAPAPRPTAPIRDGTYIVRAGDSLSSIAQAHYGDDALWRRIYDANRATIGADPNALKVGMELTIPPRSAT